jgi:hypothetical protein
MATTAKLIKIRATETLKQVLHNSSPSDTVYVEVIMATFVNVSRTSH